MLSILITTLQWHSTINFWMFLYLANSKPSLMPQHSAIRLLVWQRFLINLLIQAHKWSLIRDPQPPGPGFLEQELSEFSLNHPLGGGSHPISTWVLVGCKREELGPIAWYSWARLRAWIWKYFHALAGSNKILFLLFNRTQQENAMMMFQWMEA